MPGQALGSKNPKLAGVWLQQTVLHSTLVCVLVGVLWWYTAPVLRTLGFSHHRSELAGLFSRYVT